MIRQCLRNGFRAISVETVNACVDDLVLVL